jgi:hypothetical protein
MYFQRRPSSCSCSAVSSGYLLTAVTYWSMVPSADGTGKFKVAVGLDIAKLPKQVPSALINGWRGRRAVYLYPHEGAVVQATVACRVRRAEPVSPPASPECIR